MAPASRPQLITAPDYPGVASFTPISLKAFQAQATRLVTSLDELVAAVDAEGQQVDIDASGLAVPLLDEELQAVSERFWADHKEPPLLDEPASPSKRVAPDTSAKLAKAAAAKSRARGAAAQPLAQPPGQSHAAEGSGDGQPPPAQSAAAEPQGPSTNLRRTPRATAKAQPEPSPAPQPEQQAAAEGSAASPQERAAAEPPAAGGLADTLAAEVLADLQARGLARAATTEAAAEAPQVQQSRESDKGGRAATPELQSAEQLEEEGETPEAASPRPQAASPKPKKKEGSKSLTKRKRDEVKRKWAAPEDERLGRTTDGRVRKQRVRLAGRTDPGRLAAEREALDAVRQRHATARAEAAQVLRSLGVGKPQEQQDPSHSSRNTLDPKALVGSSDMPPAGLAVPGEQPPGDPQCVRPGELVLRVSMRRIDLPNSPVQEFLVLGSQPLRALRDVLRCPSDANLAPQGLTVPSAFFYLEGTFYNDQRQPGALDYSAHVREYCEEMGLAPPACPLPTTAAAEAHLQEDPLHAAAAVIRHDKGRTGDLAQTLAQEEEGEAAAGTFRTASMADTTFEELTLSLGPGAGYLYCHQGCCEHLLAITDCRLWHAGGDPHTVAAYPFQVYQARCTRRLCDVGCERTAAWVTYDDVQGAAAPAFWCPPCYRAMHYDADCQLLYQHRVFPYDHEY